MSKDIDDYEPKGNRFTAQFPSTCIFEEDHRIKIGHQVVKVHRKDNPFILVPGVACQACTIELRKKAR